MDSEQESPRSLDCDEIKDGIAYKIAELVRARLDTDCNLFGQAYPKFSGSVVLDLRLDDFGLVSTSHTVTHFDSQGETDHNDEVIASSMPTTRPPSDDSVSIRIEAKIPEVPPNKFRQDTDQPINVVVEERTGKRVEKKVRRFNPKKKAPAKVASKVASR